MSLTHGYLIDSDVLITAKNRYYAFSIYPGFWDSVMHYHSIGYIHSIDRVRQELLLGRKDDELVHWVSQSVPESFYLSSDVVEVVSAYTQVMLWVTRHTQYYDEAKARFASRADDWLVAHGMSSGNIVVTTDILTSYKKSDTISGFSSVRSYPVPRGKRFRQ